MCGIAGLVGNLSDCAVTSVDSMLHAMTHRGPDQDGRWEASSVCPSAVFGHRRLSILDLSEAGRQPMVHAATGKALTYNGECYNYLELREELAALGHTFQSTSDTEVVLAAYVQWGERAIERMRGMFAMALWDPAQGTVTLVRDRLGIKPLYYAHQSDRLLFASEIRALLASGQVARRIDPQALNAYLWHGFVPGPRTLVRGVHLLDAGTTLRIGADGKIQDSNRYWTVPKAAVHDDQVHARQAAEAELENAVRMRLASDVPLGVFLSGGVDSSVVAALAQRTSHVPVQTFNIRFEEAKFDESEYARAVANHLGTQHNEVLLTEQQFRGSLDAALDSLDQPTFDGINTYFVSRAVRDAGLTVALSGAGGDELFGGYASFVEIAKASTVARIASWAPQRLVTWMARIGAQVAAGAGSEIPPQTRFGKLEDILQTGGGVTELYQVSYSLFTREFQKALSLCRDETLPWGLYPERYEQLQQAVRSESKLMATSRLELASFIGERLLRDTDTASMATSLEVRVPLLDHQFIEKLAHVSETNRFQPIRKKEFLKRIMAEQVPTEIFDRPKAGFELPLEMWCKRSLLDDMDATFSDLRSANAIGLDCETVSRTWRAFKKGGAGLYWSRVWALFVLIRWCKQHGVYL